jgi:hypothetical protein
MSKFKIYREASSDPKKIKRNNRLLYIIYTIAFFLLLLTINTYYKFKEEHYSLIIYYAILVFFISITAYVILRMRKQVSNLKAIGTLEFTKSFIKKAIGDLETTYLYDNVLQIEAEKYLRDLSISSNKNGPSIFIIKIVNKDSSQDYFIVSNRSIDFQQKIGIIDTLKTVRSMTGLKTVLKND